MSAWCFHINKALSKKCPYYRNFPKNQVGFWRVVVRFSWLHFVILTNEATFCNNLSLMLKKEKFSERCYMKQYLNFLTDITCLHCMNQLRLKKLVWKITFLKVKKQGGKWVDFPRETNLTVLFQWCSWIFRGFHGKTPVLESLFNKVASPQLVFPCEIYEIFENTFFWSETKTEITISIKKGQILESGKVPFARRAFLCGYTTCKSTFHLQMPLNNLDFQFQVA